jgi:carbonic anhydrase
LKVLNYLPNVILTVIILINNNTFKIILQRTIFLEVNCSVFYFEFYGGFMKKILLMALVIAFGFLACTQKVNSLSSAGREQSIENAMTMLNDGNSRFVSGNVIHPHQDSELRERLAKDGQYPLVTVLSCADSRVPPELVFDTGLGDLFVIRVAGQVADTNAVGSAEYAVEYLGSPVVLVMGHTNCGAINAAASGAQFNGALGSLISMLNPAVEAAEEAGRGNDTAYITQEAIKMSQDQLRASNIIRTAEQEGRIRIIGAVYDMETGKVNFIE